MNLQTDLGKNFAFGNIQSLGEGISFLLGPAFAIAGLAVLFYFIFGGFKFLISGGDKGAVSDAKNMITHAIIGFILLVMLFIIMQFISQFLGFNVSVTK